MNQQNLNFDICKNRHRGNKNSIAAHRRTNKLEDIETVFNYIRDNGTSYLKEISRETGLSIQTVSARRSDLKRANRIVETGETKERCGVVRVARPGETNEIKKSVCENCEKLKAEIETLKEHYESWEGLMEILGKVYPPEVFTGERGDAGAEIVGLLRRIESLRNK